MSNLHNPRRKLHHRLFSLPYPLRMKVLANVGLIEDADEDRISRESIDYVTRGREKNLLEELWDAVEREYQDHSPDWYKEYLYHESEWVVPNQMKKFKYWAIDFKKNREKVTGTIIAPTMKIARDQLDRESFTDGPCQHYRFKITSIQEIK